MTRFEPRADRASCPGCGSPLTLEGEQALVTCPYCGGEAKVERRLRCIEPVVRPVTPPAKIGDEAAELAQWSTEALVHGILNERDLKRRVAMAKALDAWPHVSDRMAELVPVYVEAMHGTDPDLDKAMGKVLGKLVCCDAMDRRHAVIQAGWDQGFRRDVSRGLLEALGLGDAGTLKLLLEIAEAAGRDGDEDRSKAALLAAQNALGRDYDRREVCMAILLHRLAYVSETVEAWMLRFIRNHWDQGPRHGLIEAWHLFDDLIHERPTLVPRLRETLPRPRNLRDHGQFLLEVSALPLLRSEAALEAALGSLGIPPTDLPLAELQLAMDVVSPLAASSALQKVVGGVLERLANACKEAEGRR